MNKSRCTEMFKQLEKEANCSIFLKMNQFLFWEKFVLHILNNTNLNAKEEVIDYQIGLLNKINKVLEGKREQMIECTFLETAMLYDYLDMFSDVLLLERVLPEEYLEVINPLLLHLKVRVEQNEELYTQVTNYIIMCR